MEPSLTWVLRVAVVIAAALVLAGPAAAKTITGTARNDVLRGTAGNDVIYGKAGNDTIAGLAGNDLIVGGPGADRISCGPGRDTVVADAQDSIAKDCEIVKGLPAPVRRPPEGDYIGSTSQQHRFGFDVAGHGADITGISFSIDASCGADASIRLLNWRVAVAGPVAVNADRTFTATISQQDTPGFAVTGSVSGTLDLTGGGSGTVTVSLGETAVSPALSCTTGTLNWSTQRSSTPIPTGNYTAVTSQKKQLTFRSTDGATITSFSASFSAQCPNATGNFTWTWSAASSLKVGADRQATLSGQLNDGTLVNISFSFDAAGFVDGTMSFQQVPAVDPQGNKVLCATETITFAGEP